MSNVPQFCSIATVAKQLDCGETTVRDYVKQGKLPQPVRIGGLVRWEWQEVQKAMTNGNDRLDPIMEAVNGC